MTISIIVAIAQNGVIGSQGGLPWRLPSDLKRFKQDTMGNAIVMGRKTWESIGRALPGRANIVVTRREGFQAEGADVVSSLEEGLKLARARLRCLPGDEICIIGGGELYKAALPLTDRLVVTHVMTSPEGDTHFPHIDESEWEPVSREPIEAGEEDSADMLHVIYERRTGSR